MNIKDETIFRAYVEHKGFKYCSQYKEVTTVVSYFYGAKSLLCFRPGNEAHGYGLPLTCQDICKAYTQITGIEVNLIFVSDTPLYSVMNSSIS
jgi:hypothetical protein